jgi:hypothetical protein
MMGIQRADCNLWFGLDRYNSKKESIRVGTEQIFVADEMRAFANSLAVECGHALRYPVSLPSYIKSIEHMGLEIATVAGLEIQPLLESQPEVDEDLEQPDDDDLPPLVQGNNTQMPLEDLTEEEEQVVELNIRDWKQVYENTLMTKGGMSTMQAYTLYMSGNHWAKFQPDATANDLAVAEHELFMEMKDKYDRNVEPSNAKGYKRFEEAWNLEAGRRMQDALWGVNEDKIVI